MKILRLLIWASLVSCLAVASCKKDPCKDKNCLNGGVCIDGDCECAPGYIGPNCEILTDPCIQKQCVFADTCLVNNNGDAYCLCSSGYEGELCDSSWNMKYLGRYGATENCGATVFYFVDIVSGPRFNEITIANFHNAADDSSTAKVVAVALTRTALNIPQQYMRFGEVNGFGGPLPNNTEAFTLEYSIRVGSDTLQCSTVYERE